jgi:hypothetical protein
MRLRVVLAAMVYDLGFAFPFELDEDVLDFFVFLLGQDYFA